jgi:hypothetical protein
VDTKTVLEAAFEYWQPNWSTVMTGS